MGIRWREEGNGNGTARAGRAVEQSARLASVKLLNPWELLILVFVLVLIFGPKRLPQAGKALGSSIRGFKDAITDRVDKQDAEADQEQKQLTAAQPVQPAQPEPVAAQPQPDPRERDTVL
jgi:sec-independent protein translocase protein TatA